MILGLLFFISIFYRLDMFMRGDMDMMSKSLLANSYALIAGTSLRLLWQPLPQWAYHRYTCYAGQLLFALTVLAMRVDAWAYGGAIYGPFLTVPATLMAITGSVQAGNWILEVGLLRHLGRVSYSLYLWHHVFLWFIGAFNQITIQACGAVALSWIIAETSTIYMEEPLRELFKSTSWFKEQRRKVAAASSSPSPSR